MRTVLLLLSLIGLLGRLLIRLHAYRHSDYPYPLTSETEFHTFMLGPEEGEALDASISARYPDWRNRKARLGMQFNIALTDFTPETGGTQFVLGSHEYGTPPPPEMNDRPTTAGQSLYGLASWPLTDGYWPRFTW